MEGSRETRGTLWPHTLGMSYCNPTVLNEGQMTIVSSTSAMVAPQWAGRSLGFLFFIRETRVTGTDMAQQMSSEEIARA